MINDQKNYQIMWFCQKHKETESNLYIKYPLTAKQKCTKKKKKKKNHCYCQSHCYPEDSSSADKLTKNKLFIHTWSPGFLSQLLMLIVFFMYSSIEEGKTSMQEEGSEGLQIFQKMLCNTADYKSKYFMAQKFFQKISHGPS